MSGVNYITTRRKLTLENVNAEMQDILSRFFGDKAVLRPYKKNDNGVAEYKHTLLEPYDTIFSFWLESSKKLAMKASWNCGMSHFFAEWAEGVVRHEFARRWNGTLSCEDPGIGRWKPDSKPKTMLQWAARYGNKRGFGLRGEFEWAAQRAPQVKVLRG